MAVASIVERQSGETRNNSFTVKKGLPTELEGGKVDNDEPLGDNRKFPQNRKKYLSRIQTSPTSLSATQKENIMRFVVLISFALLALMQGSHGFIPRFNQKMGTQRSLSSRIYAADLNVAVVGGGPSGLLLTHLLLRDENVKVTVVERRDDPRIKDSEQRAYALGIGIRGRTAIRQVDEELWEAVKSRGFESERFQLHIGGLVIPLRSEKDGGDGVEPSLLTFQSELCAALIDELEKRHGTSGRLNLSFGARVESCDLESMKIGATGEPRLSNEVFDLIVGCDGVNSVVRGAIGNICPSFKATREQLPGEFKVVRLNTAPQGVDPTSVSLILPKKGSSGAFVEPTGNDGSCCILFSGRDDTPILKETQNKTTVVEELMGAFPKWDGFYEKIADQLMSQAIPGTASSVVCNTYHFSGKAVLAGDAAHATGGVSGQGVNSALADSVVLATCILKNRDDLARGLLQYSMQQVPEGKALYDLSFGPKPKGFKRIQWGFRSVRDTLFRGRFGIGRPPLQTRLTTDLTPFSSIRRENDDFYDEPFPSDDEFRSMLTNLSSRNQH